MKKNVNYTTLVFGLGYFVPAIYGRVVYYEPVALYSIYPQRELMLQYTYDRADYKQRNAHSNTTRNAVDIPFVADGPLISCVVWT